ncbi:MAG TPA: 50S ribosomal protein L17 [Verrucomicrobiae bacterium]|jgi:large subunit ribosomal protein L17|nr:50S ribosomal protein L17 [Verrucomicrobiae bacterium]
MRHLKRTAKLGRTSEHRNAMLANLVCSLITHRRVTTTLAKAKAARSVAEKLVTLGKKGTVHHRRLAVARLHQESAARILFKEIAPAFKDRNGGYTRIVKMNQRNGDAAQRAILEWVNEIAPEASAQTQTPAIENQPAETKPAENSPGETKAENPAQG